MSLQEVEGGAERRWSGPDGANWGEGAWLRARAGTRAPPVMCAAVRPAARRPHPLPWTWRILTHADLRCSVNHISVIYTVGIYIASVFKLAWMRSKPIGVGWLVYLGGGWPGLCDNVWATKLKTYTRQVSSLINNLYIPEKSYIHVNFGLKLKFYIKILNNNQNTIFRNF